MSNGSAVRELNDRQTHRHTDGTDFRPSTADAGGNKATFEEKFHDNNILELKVM